MIYRALNVVVALLMFVGVGLQYNDPDAAVWMAVYGVAGLLAALAAVAPGAYPWTLPALVGIVAVTWAATLVPGWIGQVELGSLFEEFEMAEDRVELARESLGLVLVAVWMAFLVFARLIARAGRRAQASAASSATDISR